MPTTPSSSASTSRGTPTCTAAACTTDCTAAAATAPAFGARDAGYLPLLLAANLALRFLVSKLAPDLSGAPPAERGARTPWEMMMQRMQATATRRAGGWR
jgi:hypothetical protein